MTTRMWFRQMRAVDWAADPGRIVLIQRWIEAHGDAAQRYALRQLLREIDLVLDPPSDAELALRYFLAGFAS